MAILSGLKGRKGKSAGEAESELALTMFIHVGPFGYRVRPPGGASDGSNDLAVEVDPGERTGLERIEQMFADFETGIPERDRKKAEHLSLLVDEPSCVFRDNRDAILATSTTVTASKLGEQYLGCREAAFGVAPFSETTEDERQEATAYAFVDVDRLKRYLAALGELGLKVTELVPTPYVMIRRAARDPQAVYGGIRFGSEDTLITLVNCRYGALLVRHLPIGMNHFAARFSDEAQVPIKQAVVELGKRSDLGQLVGPDGGSPKSAVARAIAPTAERLKKEIEATLDFFDHQNGCGRPKSLELLGETDRLNGFDAWLPKALGIPVKHEKRSMLDLMVEQPHPSALNVLTASGQGLISDGKISYSFVNRRFVKTEQKSSDQGRTPRALQSARARRGGRGGRRGAREGFLARLFKPSETSGAETAAESDRKNLIMFGTLLVVVLYFGYTEYESVDKKFERASRIYASKVGEYHGLLSATVDGAASGAVPTKAVAIDKVLWTEKFLSLAENMNVHLWFTDVYLRQGGGGRGSESEQQLVLKGAALPSTDGHIFEISNYIQALIDDKDRFMGDFKKLEFGGARIDGGERDGVIRFTIIATYDRGDG